MSDLRSRKSPNSNEADSEAKLDLRKGFAKRSLLSARCKETAVSTDD